MNRDTSGEVLRESGLTVHDANWLLEENERLRELIGELESQLRDAREANRQLRFILHGEVETR